MNWLFDTDTAKKQRSLKKLLLAFFICAVIVPWIGISTIQADETDPGEYTENNEMNFQNAAQEGHAKNLAIKIALKDEDLMNEISDLKDKEDYEGARELFKTAVNDNMQEISNKRAEGWGWGNIAKYYEVHPKYLGLGHYKHRAKHHGLNDDSSQKEAQGLALGHSKDKGGSDGAAQGRGNEHGNGGGNGHGNGGGNGGGHGGGKN
jgi:DNA-binding protein YbaB